jgi:hypothetical protein
MLARAFGRLVCAFHRIGSVEPDTLLNLPAASTLFSPFFLFRANPGAGRAHLRKCPGRASTCELAPTVPYEPDSGIRFFRLRLPDLRGKRMT